MDQSELEIIIIIIFFDPSVCVLQGRIFLPYKVKLLSWKP